MYQTLTEKGTETKSATNQPYKQLAKLNQRKTKPQTKSEKMRKFKYTKTKKKSRKNAKTPGVPDRLGRGDRRSDVAED